MPNFAFGVAPEALARFNAVMSSKLEFRAESTNMVVNEINAKRKPGTKTAVLFAPLSGSKSVSVRPIDLLRKLGTLTTPASGNMAKLSASWATLRYCWAIEPNTGSKRVPFRLSGDARRLDFHQKTLLSDEFGIAFAGLLIERELGTSEHADVSAVLRGRNIKLPPGSLRTRRQPDYVMWGIASPYYIVECKGTQSSRSQCITQMASGLGQVNSLSLLGPGRPVIKLVVGTQLLARGTQVYVVDPPEEDNTLREKSRFKPIVLENDEKLESEFVMTADSRLLRWAGQFLLADERISSVGLKTPATERPPDREIVKRNFRNLDFVGSVSFAFPELGNASPRVFRGIRAERYESIRSQSHFERKTPNTTPETEENVSIGNDDTCLAIEA
jgi:hypothetical protein